MNLIFSIALTHVRARVRQTIVGVVGALLAWCFDPRHPQVRWHAHAAFGAAREVVWSEPVA